MYKISIIVPIYGVEKYVERCAESLFNQTLSNIEYIFVDDCSKDSSILLLNAVIEKYPEQKKNIQILHHIENKGLACARNTGVNASKAEYIVHVDSDDYVAIDFAEKLYIAAKKNNADIVVCNYYKDTYNGLKRIEVPISIDNIVYTKMLLRRRTNVQVVFKLYKRSLLLNNRVFSIQNINNGEDYAIVSRLSYYAKKICKVNDYLYFYNLQNVNSYTYRLDSRAINEKIKAQEILNVFFSNVKDEIVYRNTIIDSKLYQKISLLMVSDLQYYPVIRDLYVDIDICRSTIPLQHKIILKLLAYNMDRLIYWIFKIRRRIVQ